MLGDNLEGEARELGAAHARQALDLAKRAAKPDRDPVRRRDHGDGARQGPRRRAMSNICWPRRSRPTARRGIWGLAADTDGVDGAEDIAGAIFTPDTLARARAKGRDPQAMLDDNDGHSFFEMLGDSLVTGPTRTNVNDFRATLIAP